MKTFEELQEKTKSWKLFYKIDITKELCLEAYNMHTKRGYGGNSVGWELFDIDNDINATVIGDLSIDLGRYYSENKELN